MPRTASRLPRSTLLIATLVASFLVLALLPAAAPAASGKDRHQRTYENPLAPRIPGDGTVDSCADPAVLQGQRPGDRDWYLYCTTDPLNDTDVDENGAPVFHPIPTMRSDDLVNWTYVGDALPEPPSWAADGAALWAPDVVYSKATQRYYLTFVVTDTDDDLRGPGACATTGDNAIGVAVSDSPTGPWTASDQPLVAPRPDPDAPPEACAFLWTFDPDVLGDAVGSSSVLYFGSYYGGIHATQIEFTQDGAATSGEPTRIAIGNRYEGTNVVRRGGWYWFFGSATNCCNGPLTSYGVFAARSRSPFGPFVDREGQSLLAGRVGGTPVLLPNGNRWLGVGHNSVFTDAAGKWWTAYHAADRFDPYFAFDVGFTKRPALLDPLTWVHGWPQVRAGQWASDERMPAPATDRHRPSGYHPDPVRPHRTGALLPAYSDTFKDGLDPAWEWVREPDPATYGVADGVLRWDTQLGDLAREVNSASVLARPAPRGDFVVQTRVRLNLPLEGCCQNYVQAGLLNYADDDRYLKLAHVSIWETRQTEWAKEVPPGLPEFPTYGNGVVGAPGDTTWLRVVVDRRPGEDHYTAYTSRDGQRWVRGGTWTHDLGPTEKIGLVSMGGSGFVAEFLDVTVWRLGRR
jgi:arabinan endo-1,5-alpha-L-arabinosidase